MKLLVLKSTWGMTGRFEEQFKKISEAGYDGVEGGLPPSSFKEEFAEMLARYQLIYIPMIFTEGQNHLESFKRQVEAALQWNPVKITAHSSKDYLPFDEQVAFFRGALAFEKTARVIVAHETHRGRALYSPWRTAQLLKEFPDLKLNAAGRVKPFETAIGKSLVFNFRPLQSAS